MLVAVLLNSLSLALIDYKEGADQRSLNKTVDYINFVFTVIYLFEALIKIVALGLVGHRYSYLRDPLNVLDLIIVISG